MRAVIMAGGEGTRLRPLTSRTPKPMLPLANRPMMEHVIGLLRRHGIDDIVVTLSFMPDAVRTYFGDGEELGVTIRYAIEERPLGTAGSVRSVLGDLDETFLVISGDILTDIDISAIVGEHQARSAVATIGLIPVEAPLEFGIVATGPDGTIEHFLEKPSWGQVFSDTVNTGIFVLEPEALQVIEADCSADFSADVFPALLARGAPVIGSVAEGYWEDIGTHEAYLRAHADILDGAVDVDIRGFQLGDGIWVGEGVEIHPDAQVVGPAIIGDECRIGAGARIGAHVVMGTDVRVREGVRLDRSVVHDHAYLGGQSDLRGAVVGRGCDLRRGVRVSEGAVLGDEVFVGERAVLAADVRVYPAKSIEPGAVVNSSIVSESRGARELFGREGIGGLANVDLTPEVAVRAAMAWAGTLPAGSTVVASRDTSRAARMLKRAMMAGLNASGVSVRDLEVASLPLTRWATRDPLARGGVSVRLDTEDPERVMIRFFDANGVDLDATARRKVERVVQRQDYRRALGPEIGEIEVPPRVQESYAAALGRMVDAEMVRDRGVKMVVDYSFGSTSMLMPTLLARLRADVLAVNPYASTVRASEVSIEHQLNELARLVTVSGADFGAVIDPDGERLRLVDETGRRLDPLQALLLMCRLVGEASPGDIVLPSTAPRVADALIGGSGGRVRWTGSSANALVVEAASGGVALAADLHGGFVIPEVVPAVDAAAALLRLMGLVVGRSSSLGELVDELPDLHRVEVEVNTPWSRKGMVMRRLVEEAPEGSSVLADGIKLVDDAGWVLILPDPEQACLTVIADADDGRSARRLANATARRIRQLAQ